MQLRYDEFFISCIYLFSFLAVQHERLPRKVSLHPTLQQKQYFKHCIPNVIDFTPNGIPPPPAISPTFYLDALSPLSIPSPTMLFSPTAFPNFSRFPLSQPQQSPINAKSYVFKFISNVIPKETNTKTSPISIHAPSPPVTPLSKKSSEYSIESLLKIKTNDERIQPIHPPTLTPPSSPTQMTTHDTQQSERVQESLLRILESAIAKTHTIPAFQDLSSDLKSNILEDSWMQVFLLGIYEIDYPLEQFTTYLQNMMKLLPGFIDFPGLVKMSLALHKLREYGVDKTELAYLRAITIFNPGEGLNTVPVLEIRVKSPMEK